MGGKEYNFVYIKSLFGTCNDYAMMMMMMMML